MAYGRSQDLYAVSFDEREECWYVAPARDRGIPLSREGLAILVSLFNEIHRGNPLTLIERRAMVELGEERRDLEDTIQTLQMFRDDPDRRSPARSPLVRLSQKLRHAIERRLEQVRVF